MADKYKEDFARAVKAIVAALPKDATAELRALAEQFYVKLPPMDLETLNTKEAADVVTASFEFLQSRTVGEPKIRIFSHRSRTIVEMLNEDMPFLVDSASAELSRQGLTVYRITHPILRLKRDPKGQLLTVAAIDDFSEGFTLESFIRLETSRVPESLDANQLIEDLKSVLTNVRYTVDDWTAMRSKIDESIKEVSNAPSGFKQEEVSEMRDFLVWLSDKNFVFLGYIEYDFYDAKGKQALSVVPDSELGVFRSTTRS